MTVEEIFNDFWADIVLNEDGTLDVEQVKKELTDYHDLLHNVSLVYTEVTRGRVSKPNTKPDAVIGEYEAGVQDAIEEAFPDELREFLWSDDARDVTGSYGFTSTMGDEFREKLMAVAEAKTNVSRHECGPLWHVDEDHYMCPGCGKDFWIEGDEA